MFAKSHHQCKKLDNVLKSCGENVKLVRHIGIQCDDTSGTLMNENGMVKAKSIDSAENNDVNKLVTSIDKISDLPVAAQVILNPTFIINIIWCFVT